ncbi:MAG: AAA family ATPase [Oscillospiraceae bacterium]|nr:AAA family ATPase [Oscillospiraceae bacterium]
MEKKDSYIEISGTVKAVMFQNDENGYTVIRLETQDGATVTVVGCLPYACPGEQLTVTGEYTRHSVHGEQFKAEWAERMMPEGAEAIYEYLASGALRGVGPATATLIVSAFGGDSLRVIENEPERLGQVKGIGRKKALELSEAFKKQVGMRRLLEFLGNYEIRPIVAIRLFHDFGEKSLELLQENPYIIAGERIGASFAEADELALKMGFEDDCAERVEAAAIYELWHNSRNGHTFIPADKLVAATSQLIEVGAEAVEEALDVLSDSGEIIRTVIAEREGCYLASLFEAEVYTAGRIKEMSGEKISLKTDIDTLIARIEREQAVSYADMQRHSLKIAAQRQIMVLTGGPGTGKTTTVRAIVSLFEKLGLKTLLTAPTGRAAKRMSELTGRDAATVHRLLEAGFSEQRDELIFKRDEDEPLVCDAVILDECSMVDISLMAALLRAMPPECRLVMVGDADQLPSVGPGNVFLDIIRSNIVETVRLTEIFRQGAESRIVANAHRINRGDHPELSGNSSASDFFFLRRTEQARTVETIVELCNSRLPEKMNIPAADIQVLSPTRRGETGTRYLNAVLQKALNPASPAKKEKKFGEIVFREGDRVMQTRNNYDIIWSHPEIIGFSDEDGKAGLPVITLGAKPEHGTGIFNGDIGVVAGIDSENETMSILFDDRLAYYGFDMLPELEHAFAMTVHKSQGSEFKAVILAVQDGSPQLMSRSILYTAVTRARELLIIVGNDSTVFRMIDNQKVTRRYSGLRARLTD